MIVSPSPIAASSFLRFVDLPFDDAALALSSWWEAEQRGGSVAIGDRARLGPVRLGPGGAHVSFPLRYHRGPGAWLPMEVEVTPWTRAPAMTRMEVVALRRVQLGARYFEVGHTVLDAITTELQRRKAVRGLSHGESHQLALAAPR
jgi:hypothetical protein